MSRALSRVGCGLLLCGLGACFVDHDMRVVPTETLMPWLRAGDTSRAELLLILGPPARQLEGGRLLMWEIRDDGFQAVREPGGRIDGPLSLVVVAGPERVERVSLVRLWR